ncbi:WGR domain-containing protein [Pararhizobium antarcticum]
MATDSKLSLDAERRISDPAEMIAQPYHLYVERTDFSKNMARYYAMEISMTLFGEACLTRSWGRIGKRGQSMRHHFGQEKEAVDLFLDLVRQKRARGYRPVACEGIKSRNRRHDIV